MKQVMTWKGWIFGRKNPALPGVEQYFKGVTLRVWRVGRKVPSQLLQILTRDEIRGLLRGNITQEPATEFLHC